MVVEEAQPNEPRLLAIETSHSHGELALAHGERILGVRSLADGRRHARDLVPMVKELLEEQSWRPFDLDAVIVSRGPGSYTGLRVGLMSAKALAYAIAFPLFAIETMAVIANQAPEGVRRVDVLIDAQQDRVYVQGWARDADQGWFQPTDALRILPFAEWAAGAAPGLQVLGPGLMGKEQRLPPGISAVEPSTWFPQATTLLRLGLRRWLSDEDSDNFWTVEPLYLRPSAAEQQWAEHTKLDPA